MIIPEDFQLVPYTHLIKINDRTFIEIYETPDADFYSYTIKNLKKGKPSKTEGYIWKKWNEFEFNGYDALLTIMETDDNRYKLSFLFGDNDFDVYIYAIYSEDEVKEESKIIDMLLSICYDKDAIIDYEKNKFFEIDFLSSGYKFYKVSQNDYIYSKDGFGNPENVHYKNNKIFVSHLSSIKSKSDIVNYSKKEIDMYKNNGAFKNFTVIKNEDLTINGVFAKAVTAKISTIGYDSNGEQVFYPGYEYLVITGNEDMGVVFTGRTFSDDKEELQIFEEIVKTLKIKKSN